MSASSLTAPGVVRHDSHSAGVLNETVAHPSAVATPAQSAWVKSGSGYSEAQTFYLFPDAGGIASIQIAYSELGVSPISQVTLSFRTHGLNIFKSFSYSGSAHKLADDRCSSTCNDCSFTRHPDGRYTVSLKSKEATVQFDVAFASPSDVTTVGDAKIHFTSQGAARADGFLSQVYGLGGAAKGIATVNGVVVNLDGRCNIVHQHQGIAPYKLAQEWDFFTLSSKSISASSVAGTTPKSSYAGAPFSTIAARIPSANGGEPEVAVSTHVEYSFRSSAVDPATGYAVPTHAVVTATLSTGHTLEVTSALNFGKVIRVDVLGELPWLIRKAIALFVSKPYLYQFAEQGKVVLKDSQGNVVVDEVTDTFVEVSYTNPSS